MPFQLYNVVLIALAARSDELFIPNESTSSSLHAILYPMKLITASYVSACNEFKMCTWTILLDLFELFWKKADVEILNCNEY